MFSIKACFERSLWALIASVKYLVMKVPRGKSGPFVEGSLGLPLPRRRGVMCELEVLGSPSQCSVSFSLAYVEQSICSSCKSVLIA